METANTKGRRLTVRKDGVPCYDIVYRSSFEDLGQESAGRFRSVSCRPENPIRTWRRWKGSAASWWNMALTGPV